MQRFLNYSKIGVNHKEVALIQGKVFQPRLFVDSKWIAIWLSILAISFAIPQVEYVVVSYMSLRALKGGRYTMEAAIVVCFYILANSVFVVGATREALRYLFLLCGFLALFPKKNLGKISLVTWLWGFVLFFSLVSVFVSAFPAISILKVISFFLGAYIMVKGFSQCKPYKVHFFRLLNAFFVFIVYSSLLLFLLGYGYEANGRGFQGVFSHPQIFGPVMGVVTTWFLGLVLAQKSHSKFLYLTTAISLAFIFMSLARTGMVALLLGGGLAYLISFSRPQNHRFAGQAVKLAVGLVIAGILFALSNPSFIDDTLVSFIQKREGAQGDASFNELFNNSRGALTLTSMDNFRANPLLGIGFGVPSNVDAMEGVNSIKYLWGIPVSASVEKGFLPTAILEEIGIIGGITTLAFLLIPLNKIRKRFSFPTLWLFLTAILINIGEAIFYSVGGMGFFMWLIVGISFSFDFFVSSYDKKVQSNRGNTLNLVNTEKLPITDR